MLLYKNTIDFLFRDLVSCNLAKLLYSNCLLIESLELLMYKVSEVKWNSQLSPALCNSMDCSLSSSSVKSSANRNSFASFSFWMCFICFSCPIALARRNSQTMLNWHGKWSESPTLCDPHGLYHPWNSPGQNTGVGSLSLLQGLFPTQGSNLGLLHCRRFFTNWATREVQECWSG